MALRPEIAFADDVAILVAGDLAGTEYDLPRTADLDTVRISAERRMQGLRVQVALFHSDLPLDLVGQR